MKNLLGRVSNTLATASTLTISLALYTPAVNANSLLQKDLFFGRNLASGGEVSQEQFQAFVDNLITPSFPDGLTIFDANGQFLDNTGKLIEEKSKLVTLFVEDTPKSRTALDKITQAYLQQFNQQSVLQVTNSDDLKVGFGAGENLIDNDPIPEFIQADLFFGRNIAGGGEVSEEQFQAFVDQVITPRFPAGLTIFDTDGQFQDSTGTIIEEKSKGVRLLLEDSQNNETAIDEIITAYLAQFKQESVLLAVNEDVAVGFGAGENLIDNDPIPEFIQADLFFGRNIAGGGEVSEEQFQAFVDQVITPRFPAGLTIFDTDGQFQDSTGTIIEEKSKGVRLLFEDTQNNETAIDEIITAYLAQFNQESVLVVDEDVNVAFEALPTKSVPEPSSILGLLVFGVLGTGGVLRRSQKFECGKCGEFFIKAWFKKGQF
jgi:hypothetical protein